MSDQLKRVRKGTKSCTECRRRKVRCIWSSDEAPRCRRCEERGSNCVAQLYSIQSSASRRLTSRDRIARLEQQLTSLTSALQAGGQDVQQNVTPFDIPMSDPEPVTDTDSEDSFFGSEGFDREVPSHLQALFENDLLSTDTSNRNASDLQKSKVITELSTAVRYKLQELIPPRKEVEVISGFAGQWLSLFHSLFPAPSMIKSGQEMVEQYEAIQSSTIDPAYLASWLLSIAMTIYQVPKGKLGPEQQLKGFRNAHQFAKSVSDVAEATIMRYDALLGTIQGIDAAMLFLRLQLSRGNFKKTWLQLRRVIAIAELIGLHRAARRATPVNTVSLDGDVWPEAERIGARKAQVWESLCSVDRIAGMMFNLPPGTRRYRLPQHTNIINDGVVSLRAYLSSLSELAMKVQDMDDLELPQHPGTELYAEVLKIDGELRVLASVTPATWWNSPSHPSDHLLQYWHFYITIRIHLKFTLRHDTGEQYSFSRLACMKACQSLIERYQVVRAGLPGGFFLCRVVDLQTFTAMVVLTLAYHAASPTERSNLLAHGSSPPERLIPQAIDFMSSLSDDPMSNYARQAVGAVDTLTQLLDADRKSDIKGDLKLKVPLLGKLHVRRKQEQTLPVQHQHEVSNDAVSQENLIQNLQPSRSLQSDINGAATADMAMPGSQDGCAWDPWSWSIEDDQSGLFQDALVSDDYTPFGPWWEQSGTGIEPQQ